MNDTKANYYDDNFSVLKDITDQAERVLQASELTEAIEIDMTPQAIALEIALLEDAPATHPRKLAINQLQMVDANVRWQQIKREASRIELMKFDEGTSKDLLDSFRPQEPTTGFCRTTLYEGPPYTMVNIAELKDATGTYAVLVNLVMWDEIMYRKMQIQWLESDPVLVRDASSPMHDEFSRKAYALFSPEDYSEIKLLLDGADNGHDGESLDERIATISGHYKNTAEEHEIIALLDVVQSRYNSARQSRELDDTFDTSRPDLRQLIELRDYLSSM